MIIKSMTRKKGSFGQLIEYMNRHGDNTQTAIWHNCATENTKELKTIFEQNAAYMKARKNGVYLYHEIISIIRIGNISEAELKQALSEIAQKYIEMRCPNNLVYGVLHDDHGHHLHYHLMISANGLRSEKRMRLSRAQFKTLKIEFERRVLAEYPQLKQDMVMGKKTEKTSQKTQDTETNNTDEKLSQTAYEVKRRTGETPKLQSVKETILHIFENTRDYTELISLLRSAQLDLYVRGKNYGVVNLVTGTKYRLATLGLQEKFELLSQQIDSQERAKHDARDQAREEAQKRETEDRLARERETARKEALEAAKRGREAEIARLQELARNQATEAAQKVTDEARRQTEDMERYRVHALGLEQQAKAEAKKQRADARIRPADEKENNEAELLGELDRRLGEKKRRTEKMKAPLGLARKAAVSALEKGKSVMDGFLDPFTPTDQAAKAARLKREAAEARQRKYDQAYAERGKQWESERRAKKEQEQTDKQAEKQARLDEIERVGRERAELFRQKMDESQEHENSEKRTR